jgi:glutathionyl-hydroquinone reductase
VPALWDRQTSRLVSNNFPDITIDLGTQFGAWANPGVDPYPEPLRPEIDALNEVVYATVNDGVYRCGFAASQEAYEATEPGYDGHISVPVLWDRETSRIVSNNFPDITIDLGTQFGAYANGACDLYPERLRPEIDAINAVVYENVNNGVYRSGMATTQAAYHDAVTRLFATLDDLEERLADQRYLCGETITEADVRLWVTLARFDAVYYSHFKVNLRRLTDYPNLWAYARDLYALPAFRDTTDFGQIKRHYFTTHPFINPTRIVPDGPLLDWNAPHGRGAS